MKLNRSLLYFFILTVIGSGFAFWIIIDAYKNVALSASGYINF